MPDYVTYDVTLSLLTPMHIGNGRELLNEYDYAIHKGKTWRINEDALLDEQDVDDPRLAEQLARTKPKDLLNPADFHADSGLFRYVLEGTPRSEAEGAVLREQIKTPFDKPYLPGSSLKGALRTALAWYAWKASGMRPEVRDLGRSAKWAAQEYEHQLFGQNPNHDLLRVLHVGDSEPLEPARLMIVNARVLNRAGGLGSPIELEALKPDTPISLKIKLDRVLFSDWARHGGLDLQGSGALGRLAQVVQAHSAEQIRREVAWFEKIPGATRVLQFYQQLAQARLGSTRCLVRLGWGTGWEGKTFGSRLQEDPQFMERIIQDFRLARGRRQPGDPFPKSRRVAVAFARAQNGQVTETAATPFGWALMEMNERQ